MIARTWQATATTDGAARYHAHFTGSVLPELRELAGFRSAYLLRRATDDRVEIQVVTLWDSWDAIAAFAGATPDRAVVEPGAREVLLGYDATVRHFEAVEFPGQV